MMTVKVPKSLFDHIKDDLQYRIRQYDDAVGVRLQIMGPYGIYAIEPVPDEDYTVEVIETVKKYKET
jgi:hypothetical protein